MTESRVVRFVVAGGRSVLMMWHWLGDIDRVLVRSYVRPDCKYERATTLVADSAIVRLLGAIVDRFKTEGSVAVATAVASRRLFERFSRWQLVRVIGVAFSTALITHAALYLVLPRRFGEQLPAIAWVAIVALAATLVAAPRQFVAAWDEWRR